MSPWQENNSWCEIIGKISSSHIRHRRKSTTCWKPGMFCRSIYGPYSIEYEGVVLSIDESLAVIQFVGIYNVASMPFDELFESSGDESKIHSL